MIYDSFCAIFPTNSSTLGGNNGFQKMYTDFGFADLALASSLKHNRSLKLMEKLKNYAKNTIPRKECWTKMANRKSSAGI